jgi:WD40 repeat protein
MEGKKPVVTFLHPLKAVHKSPITCVQCVAVDAAEGSNLVEFYSVSDNVLQVWRMKNEGPPTREQELDHRKGDVAVLGNDGKRVLFDENGELRLHNLADPTKVEGRLRNPPGTSSFTNMALFAPNGKTILTNVAADGRLQLWRTPPYQKRGSELRQFVRPSNNATSGNVCAAFAPDSSFVVTGQGVDLYIWKMPNEQEIASRLTARIVRVERSLDNSSQQVPIWAELDKHEDWISAGGHATMVIDLNQPVPAAKPAR